MFTTAANFTVDGRSKGLIDNLEGYINHFDHFLFVNDEDFVIVADNTPVVQAADMDGGWLQLATDAGTNNDEVYLSSGESLKFTSGKKLHIGAKVKLTEANTDDANILFGLTDQGGANTLVDDGGGPPSSYSGAVLFKVDGTLNWFAEASKTTSQSTLALASAPAFVSGTTYILEIVWDGAALHFWVNGTKIYTVSDTAYISTTEMTPTFGLKNGGANQETSYWDWYVIHAER